MKSCAKESQEPFVAFVWCPELTAVQKRKTRHTGFPEHGLLLVGLSCGIEVLGCMCVQSSVGARVLLCW